ncbi:MAG TPA: HAD family phosphatase [Bryobacteraceae bacterium]|jgi:putative hydrolase of the HAD superfamily
MALVDSYDGFIFDYGGVLVHHQTSAEQQQLAETAGVPSETLSELYWATRLDYDEGLVTGAEYWQRIAKGAGTLFQPDTIDRLMEIDSVSWMHYDETMWEWIAQLRGLGKRIAMLSNMPSDLGETLKSRTDRLARFDHVTLSYEVSSVKPQPAIYEHCLEGLGVPADRSIFFDDRIANCQGAEMLGLRAIEFLDRDAVLLQMRG